jgi:hypothetical protein
MHTCGLISVCCLQVITVKSHFTLLDSHLVLWGTRCSIQHSLRDSSFHQFSA